MKRIWRVSNTSNLLIDAYAGIMAAWVFARSMGFIFERQVSDPDDGKACRRGKEGFKI